MAELSNENSHEQVRLNILVADDHALVRGGLTLLIHMAKPGSKVIEANSLDRARDILSQSPSVDLMLLDLMMPGMQGIDGIRFLTSEWPGVPIIIISVTEDASTIRQALAAGAMGYIPKSSEPNVTISAMKLVLDGGVYIPPHVLNQSTDPNNDNYRSTGGSEKGILSRRQLEVLRLIQSGKSNNAIAEELGLSTGTVKMHVSGIFKKLKVSNRTEAVAIYSQLESEA
jgi:DNA-binding NarL/FixJ family response regulator